MSENEENITPPVPEPEPEPEPEPVPVRVGRTVARPVGRGKQARPPRRQPAAVQQVPSRKAAVSFPEEEEEQDQALANAFSAVQSALRRSANAEEAQEKLNSALAAIGNLDDKTARHLAASEEFQQAMIKIASAAQAKPGDPILDEKGREIGRVPLSFKDMQEIYPEYSWIPPRHDIIEVNGVSVEVWEGVPAKGPKIFYDIQMEAIAAERRAANAGREILEHSPVAYGDGFSLEVGWRKMSDEELLAQPGNREV